MVKRINAVRQLISQLPLIGEHMRCEKVVAMVAEIAGKLQTKSVVERSLYIYSRLKNEFTMNELTKRYKYYFPFHVQFTILTENFTTFC